MNLWDACTGKVSRMSYVNRFSSFPVNRRENVAEHSWWVAFISFLIYSSLSDRDPIEPRIDLGKLLSRAISHDLNECLSGDIIRSYKYSSSRIRKAIEDADVENMNIILEEIGSVDVALSWQNAKDIDIEGDIIRFADMAAVVFYLREEQRSGQNYHPLALVKEMYEKWFYTFHDHKFLGQYADSLFPNRDWRDAFRVQTLPNFPIMENHSEGPTSEWAAVSPEHDPLS